MGELNNTIVDRGVRRNVYENRNYKKWVPKNKVYLFKKLFADVKEQLGTRKAAIKYIGMSNGSMDLFNKKLLSETTARLIFNAHRKLIKRH